MQLQSALIDVGAMARLGAVARKGHVPHVLLFPFCSSQEQSTRQCDASLDRGETNSEFKLKRPHHIGPHSRQLSKQNKEIQLSAEEASQKQHQET